MQGLPSPVLELVTLAVLHRGQALQVRKPRQGFAGRSCLIPTFDFVQSGKDLASQLLVFLSEPPCIAREEAVLRLFSCTERFQAVLLSVGNGTFEFVEEQALTAGVGACALEIPDASFEDGSNGSENLF